MTDFSSEQVTAVTVIRYADLTEVLWKNGGGVTREIAAYPPGAAFDAFAWRLSIADVAHAGPFSRFPDVDRTLVLLAGEGMCLEDKEGSKHCLRKPLDVYNFPGDLAIYADLVQGPTRDFNLMVHRRAVCASLMVWREGTFAADDADTLLFFCVERPTGIVLGSGEMYGLDALDTLRIDAPGKTVWTLCGDGGAVLAIRLTTLAQQ